MLKFEKKVRRQKVNTGVHFIMSLDPAALSDRKPACAGNLQNCETGI